MCRNINSGSSLSLSPGWLVGHASSLVGLQGLGSDTDRGVRFSAVARAHVRPGGLAGLVLWFGELVGTPSVESSSGFLVQFRVFGSSSVQFRGSTSGVSLSGGTRFDRVASR